MSKKVFTVLVSLTLIAITVAACAPPVTGSQSGPEPPTEPAPDGSIEILISSSNTKEDWMNAMVGQFNAEYHSISSGQKVFVRVTHVTSGGSQKAILEGKSKPVVWSPGDQSWIDGANLTRQQRAEKPLITQPCPPTVLAPIGFAMWRPMAEALGWPDDPISWDNLVELSADPQGWASKGHPEWESFKFGHTHPGFSNTGMLSLTAFAYGEMNKTSGLTVDQIYSDRVKEAFRYLEQNTFHYGIQNRPLMQTLAKRGPEYLHAITSSEAEVLKANAEFADEMLFQLVFVFPAKGTYWSEQPYCILETEWVSDQQRKGAEVFRDFILARPQQEKTIDYYIRPVDESIPLHDPITLSRGTNPNITTDKVPALESPTAEINKAVVDVFNKVKKKATMVILLDISGSMNDGGKIKAAVESTKNFISRMDGGDEVYVITFGGGGVLMLEEGGLKGTVSDSLITRVSGLYGQGGTPLYDAVCEGISFINNLQVEDEQTNEKRLYGIVLLSDGKDSGAGKITRNQMLSCLPSGIEVEGVKIFTIAYGSDADKEILLIIAVQSNGKTFTADPESLESIYNAISAEQ